MNEPRAARPPRPLGYATGAEPIVRWRTRRRVLLACAFVLGFGVLLGQGLVRGAIDRVVLGGETVAVWGFVVLTPVSLVFVAAGLAGFRYWWLERKGKPLPETSSRLILLIRGLFHDSWGH